MTQTNGTTTAVNPAALAVRHEAPIEPTTMGELQTLATAAAKSNFFGAKTPEQALMILMAGRSLGLDYSQSLRAFHVIEQDGRPPKLTLSADGMVAVCLQNKAVCEYFRIVESDDRHATVEAKRAGDPPRKLTFTFEEAQRAGLVREKSNWVKWPARMCLARAKSFLARDLFADLLLGLYDPDEIRDTAEPERVHVEPVRVVPPVVADAEYTQVEDPSIAESERLEKALLATTSLDERDAVVKEIVKAHKAGRIGQIHLDGLIHTATERKKALAGAA